MIYRAKSSFFRNKLDNLSKNHDSRKLCRELRELGTIDSKTPQSTTNLSLDELNDFFISSVTQIQIRFNSDEIPISRNICRPPVLDFTQITSGY